MANQQHVGILLRDGVNSWNLWRKQASEVRPDLSGADLSGADLSGADLSDADLSRTHLNGAHLTGADLSRTHLNGAHLSSAHLSDADLFMADLSDADLIMADLSQAHLRRAHFSGADLSEAHLSDADLTGADLSGADLTGADLTGADLSDADLSDADLSDADLSRAILSRAILSRAVLSRAVLSDAVLFRAIFIRANLSGANLSGADLSAAHLRGANLSAADFSRANLTGANLSGADLTDCDIYGVSVWDVRLDDKTVQKNLRITPPGQSAITVDNLEVAQFLYLLLHNDKARAILDTITSKVVLILGRFGEHKAYLDALREALRNHPKGYIPVLFDFDPQADRSILETVKILAHLARFVIADLTDPRMVRSELQYIIPNVPSVPVQPIVEGDTELLTEYSGWRKDYKSFLRVYRYADLDDLLANLTAAVIEPVEAHVQARRLSSDAPDID